MSGLLGVVGPIDPCFGWELGCLRWLSDEAFRVGGVRGIEHAGPLLAGDFGGAVVHVGRRMKRQPAVAMLLVVQGAGPQVRLFSQPRGDVVNERIKRIRTGAGPYSGLAVTGQILADFMPR